MRSNEIYIYGQLERVNNIQDEYRENNRLRLVAAAKEKKKEFKEARYRLVRELGSDDPDAMVKLIVVMIKGLKRDVKSFNRKIKYLEESKSKRSIHILGLVLKEAQKQRKINKDPSDY